MVVKKNENRSAFIYLAEVVLTSISKDPVAAIEILDSDRHQRASECLPLTEKTAEKKQNKASLESLPSRFRRIHTNYTVLSGNVFSGEGTGKLNVVNDNPPTESLPAISGVLATLLRNNE